MKYVLIYVVGTLILCGVYLVFPQFLEYIIPVLLIVVLGGTCVYMVLPLLKEFFFMIIYRKRCEGFVIEKDVEKDYIYKTLRAKYARYYIKCKYCIDENNYFYKEKGRLRDNSIRRAGGDYLPEIGQKIVLYVNSKNYKKAFRKLTWKERIVSLLWLILIILVVMIYIITK